MIYPGAPEHSVEFVPSGRGVARCAPNPDYPNGIALYCAKPGEMACKVSLPYPAHECGVWIVRCKSCPMAVAVTAAGRPDDPISVTMPCQLKGLGFR